MHNGTDILEDIAVLNKRKVTLDKRAELGVGAVLLLGVVAILAVAGTLLRLGSFLGLPGVISVCVAITAVLVMLYFLTDLIIFSPFQSKARKEFQGAQNEVAARMAEYAQDVYGMDLKDKKNKLAGRYFADVLIERNGSVLEVSFANYENRLVLLGNETELPRRELATA